MNRLILMVTAVGVFYAGPAYALTMTPTTDNRIIGAGASTQFDSDFNSDTPGPGFPTFTSEVSASASDLAIFQQQGSDNGGGLYGAWADANARQSSSVGPLSIAGSGSANASGSHGDIVDVFAGDALTNGNSDFQSHGRSLLEILFSIDESAAFDLSGFLSAGIQLAISAQGNDVTNFASVNLVNTDTDESAFKTEISNDFLNLNNSGVIGPGNYKFSVEAYAEVFGGQIFNGNTFAGDDNGLPINGLPVNGYTTNAGFDEVTLQLTAIDQPIPEPVTTTLAAMGLGALVLKTSRRRA